MYLISLYFDEETNEKIQFYINDVASCSGNTYMIDKKIPPHITLTAFETQLEESVLIEMLDGVFFRQSQGELKWVSVGAFFPNVLFLVPLLNEYLQNLSRKVYDTLIKQKETTVQKCYQPFSWLPHTTIGKRLSEEEMQRAFIRMQKNFTILDGSVVRIGLSKTTPKEEIKSWHL